MPSLNLDYKMNEGRSSYEERIQRQINFIRQHLDRIEDEIKCDQPLGVTYEDILKYHEFNGTQKEND